ncbi:DUF996 domain-containing protein [Brockia lithotrophica]|uniref:Putative membrane protein n=1 Tax=Brockia lithotrophica TaxID=933949 RepID=A0A660L8D6_9BACL|nr:DUF996 domain-containing protein [Brockia lithotrophica]RKQ89092.1 putative membrane protein [Brockia lithotrophica]
MNDGARLSQSGLYGMLAGILWIANLFVFLLPAGMREISSLLLQFLALVFLYIAFSGIGDALGSQEISGNGRTAVIFLTLGVLLSLAVTLWKAGELASAQEALQNLALGMQGGTASEAEVEEMTKQIGTMGRIYLYSFLPFWLLSLIGAFPLRKAYVQTAEATEIPQFRTAGNLFLWGIILTPLLIGGILLLVYYIFVILAFSKLRTAAQEG